MNRHLTHDEAFAALDAVALDALDLPERDAVMAHVAGCAVCRNELESLRDTASFLAFSSPLAADTASRSRDRIRWRLGARAAAETARPRVRRARVMEWLAAAATVLFVASVAALFSITRDRTRLRSALVSRDSLIAGLTGKDVAMMTLTANGRAAPFAHMFWDHRRNTWTLVAHDLPDPQPGRTYQLWLVTASGKVSVGTFVPLDGEAMVRATYPLAPSDLKALAVTEEPAGGMPQPTGPMIIAGH